tara:strand:+ start:352 stop:648 length:297 start_codon:yes stop_codon:yes gene_type:complete
LASSDLELLHRKLQPLKFKSSMQVLVSRLLGLQNRKTLSRMGALNLPANYLPRRITKVLIDHRRPTVMDRRTNVKLLQQREMGHEMSETMKISNPLDL